MARSREEVISEMVDSGLFSDDEIRGAAKQAQQPPADKYGDLKTAVSNTAHFGLPVLGAAGGAALTSPGLFTGAPIVGGAAGYAVGSGAARKLDDLMGLKKPLPVKQEFAETGKDLQMGALAELVPQAAIKTGGAALRGLKNNPQIIGSAIDAMGGLPSGTARVAIQNPEITQAGYYTFGKIKDFAGKLHESLNGLEEAAQKKWASLRDSIDSAHGGAGKVDRFSVAKAIQEAKESMGTGKMNISVQHNDAPFRALPSDEMNQNMKVQYNDQYSPLPSGEMNQNMKVIRGKPSMKAVDPFAPKTYGLGDIAGQSEVVSPEEAIARDRLVVDNPRPSIPSNSKLQIKQDMPVPGKSSSSLSFNKQSTGPAPEADAISKIEEKFNSLTEPASYGGYQAKGRLNLRDLTDLRQTTDYYINWDKNGGPALSKNGQRVLKQVRSQIDGLISGTPEYSSFKGADQSFSDMINTSKQARSTFGIRAGKDLEDLTTDELKQIEMKVKGSLKKGGAEREAISAMDKKLNTGMSILDEAEKLAASGGATPERALPFERTLRPGTGYALLNSAGLGGAGASLALHHPLAAAGVIAGQGASMAMTSPRMLGLAIRSARPLINSAKAAAPTISRELAALLSMALEKRRQQNAH